MNKIACFLTGGHRYKAEDWKIVEEPSDRITIVGKCDKCGKKYETEIPCGLFDNFIWRKDYE